VCSPPPLSYLTIYRDPVVANNVSRSDFRIRDLMHSEGTQVRGRRYIGKILRE